MLGSIQEEIGKLVPLVLKVWPCTMVEAEAMLLTRHFMVKVILTLLEGVKAARL